MRGLASAARNAAFSFVTTSRGVPPGAITMYHPPSPALGYPACAVVGTSGKAGSRTFPCTESAFNLPALICGNATGAGTITSCTRPPIRSDIASGVPLYGTWTRFVPLSRLKTSICRCPMLPTPPVP